MEKSWKDLREHATRIFNYEKKKEMLPLTDELINFIKRKSLPHM